MERKTELETKIEAVLEITAKELIENLNANVYEKNPGALQKLKINFTNADADTEFERVIALLQEKGLSRHVTSVIVTGYRESSVKLSKLPSNIGTLTALTSLFVSSNQLTTLAGIEQLKALTSLLVSDNQLTTLAGIEQLTGLTLLDVSGNQLTTLAGIEQLKALTQLHVSSNQLTTLAGIEQLKALAQLDVSRNKLTTLAGIEQLKALAQLDVNNNQLTRLPVSLGNCAALQLIQFEGNRLEAGTLRTIEELKAQFLKLQQAYRRVSEIKDLVDENTMMPPTITETIFGYDNIPISENAELNSLSAEELEILKKSISTEKVKDTKAQKKIDNLKIITDLHEAINNNNFEAFQKLLSEAQHMSINLNIKTGDAGYTLLHSAILNNASREFTRLLLERGANPNQPDINGYTPVATAAVRGNHDILAVYQQHLPQAGQAFLVAITPETWKNAARQYNNIKDENPNGEINYKEVRDILEGVLKDLGIVLEQPAEKQNIDVQLQLLSYILTKDYGNFRKTLEENPKIDLNVAVKGTRLLHAATARGDEEIVKLLLGGGADLNLTIVDSEGQAITPVHIAAHKNLQNMLNIYQESKKVTEEIWADAHRIAQIKQKEVKIKQPEKIKKLFDAIATKQFELFDSMLSENPEIDLDAVDSEHRSLLHAASRADVPSAFAQKLLELGADPNMKRAVTWQGSRMPYTPLDIAVGEGRADLIPFYQNSEIPVQDRTWQHAQFMMEPPYVANHQSADADYPKTHELVRKELVRVSAKTTTSASPSPVFLQRPKEKLDKSSEQKINKEDTSSNKKTTP